MSNFLYAIVMIVLGSYGTYILFNEFVEMEFGFSIRTNNLKLSSSRLLVDIVSAAMLICGISGYRNDSKFSLARHLRDAFGAQLMVNNDRILKLNATMLMVHREAQA